MPVEKRILLVDDDDTFRETLGKTLVKEGYHVTHANQSKVAKELIGLEEFDIVISDINMPGGSGIELMHHCKKVRPGLPVVLITGFSDLKETEEAYEMGARGFLPKPFKKEELFEILNLWLHSSDQIKKEEDESQDDNYCKLSIDDFISGHQIKFDIYIRLSDKKYLKIAHSGEEIAIERIKAFKAKNLQYLYMSKDDFRRYMDFNLALLPMVKNNSTISKDKKRTFLRHTSEVIFEHLHLNGVDEEGFQMAKTIVEATASLMTEPDDMMNLIQMLDKHSDHLYAHGLGVSLYSVIIARQVKWSSPANIYKVAMGGLLHDIGLKEIPPVILQKHRKDMTHEEVQMYESHAQRGLEILSQLKAVPTDILQIILQHHEDCTGLGYPRKLTKKHIHPMARLVSVADEFCMMVLKGPESLNLSPVEALERMNTLFRAKFDPVFLNALMRAFKMRVPQNNKNTVVIS